MSRQELYFTAYGIPRPQGSKRHVGRGILIEASDVKPWRRSIAEAVSLAFEASGDDSQFTEAVVVTATFYLPKPKTVKRLLPSVAPDLDKLQRALGDALSIDSPALTDDSLIVRWHAKKLYAETPDKAGVMVAIQTIQHADRELPQNVFDIDD
jgi:crossover junction endodeoxyribonuclease RusA